MVSDAPGNVQRGDLLVYRVIQDLRFCLQCRALGGAADHREIRSGP